MITPLDIQNKKFGKGVRGYKEEEVDVFLNLIIMDLEKIIKENANLKNQIGELEDDLAKYKSSESEVVKVLKQAQRLMGDISISAEKRAEILLKNAEMDAELTIREARDRAERLKEENINFEKRYVGFKEKYKKMLEDELARFENKSEDLIVDFDDNKLEELINAPMRNQFVEDSSEDKEKTYNKDSFDEKKTVIINMKEKLDEKDEEE